MKLLTRDQFREQVFERDKHKCVVCGAPAQDAHHIMERRLFPDGGYYLDNGASVCGPCHIKCETTEIAAPWLSARIGAKYVVLPPHLYRDQLYDKWGNPIISEDKRLPGDLFFDPSVQKVLEPFLHLFVKHVKYPRTFHLPWSPGVGKDDRIMPSLEAFEGNNVVVTVKMDGENTNLYNDYMHARSLTTDSHPSRDRTKALWGRIKHEIPDGWRICGENLYAKHSIHYKNIEDHFLVFSIWNEHNMCLSWSDTQEYAAMLGLKTVPVLYEGPWDEKLIRGMYTPEYAGDACEGYVVRVSDSFAYGEFRKKVGKYVREGHVATSHHWRFEAVVPNEWKEG